jgi:hypothetical protein
MLKLTLSLAYDKPRRQLHGQMRIIRIEGIKAREKRMGKIPILILAHSKNRYTFVHGSEKMR